MKSGGARLKDLGERGVISLLRRQFPPPGRDVLVGIGDDAAVVRPPSQILVTKDLLVEGFDFRRELHPPRLLGRKSLNVNLSDVAAMGGLPLYALLGLGLPGQTELAWIKEFLSGFRHAAGRADVALVGGDLSEAQSIMISVTVIGGAEHPVGRSGARPGDGIFVSGTLGDAAAGLELVAAGTRMGEGRGLTRLLRAFLDPKPRLELGAALSGWKLASAMIDLSDGLSQDLARICEESRVGAEIDSRLLPLSGALRRLGRDPVRFALHGGEDFELLFSVRPRNIPRLESLGRLPKISRIGRIVEGKDITIVNPDGSRIPLQAGGWEHFKA